MSVELRKESSGWTENKSSVYPRGIIVIRGDVLPHVSLLKILSMLIKYGY